MEQELLGSQLCLEVEVLLLQILTLSSGPGLALLEIEVNKWNIVKDRTKVLEAGMGRGTGSVGHRQGGIGKKEVKEKGKVHLQISELGGVASPLSHGVKLVSAASPNLGARINR